jgi:hypothetical protein
VVEQVGINGRFKSESVCQRNYFAQSDAGVLRRERKRAFAAAVFLKRFTDAPLAQAEYDDLALGLHAARHLG